ncbi:MAG: hypothetical protein AAF616_03560 [Bacteroidota bacterium]
MIRKIFKFLGIALVSFLLIAVVVFWYFNESLPEGVQGAEAELLADEMLDALGKTSYDSISQIEFTYVGSHSIKWDKFNNAATVSWSDKSVNLDLNSPVEDMDLLQYKAYQFFINDTFWLVAPFKIKDNGVVRSIVEVPEGRGLLVTHSKGGVTPGDSYLWIIDERGFPIAWKMWTNIIPIGGVELSWEDWTEKEGVWFSQLHRNGPIELKVTDLNVVK